MNFVSNLKSLKCNAHLDGELTVKSSVKLAENDITRIPHLSQRLWPIIDLAGFSVVPQQKINSSAEI